MRASGGTPKHRRRQGGVRRVEAHPPKLSRGGLSPTRWGGQVSQVDRARLGTPWSRRIEACAGLLLLFFGEVLWEGWFWRGEVFKDGWSNLDGWMDGWMRVFNIGVTVPLVSRLNIPLKLRGGPRTSLGNFSMH